MLVHALIAIILLLAVGVAFNVIGELATKKQ